mgnify:CR=1 FL=1
MPTGTVARLSIQLLANPSQLISGFAQAQSSIQTFSASASGLIGKIAALSAGLGAGGILGFGLKLAADLEKAHFAFGVMLGDVDKAKVVLEDLRSFADFTPFQGGELRDAAQLLIAANVAAEDILPTLSMLGDIALGDAVKLQLVAKAFTDVLNKGRLQGQEIRQFTENGVPLLAVLADQLGKNKREIVAMSEAGEISFADVQRALIAMVQEGGSRFGLMEKQSQTLAGRWSTLVDTAKRLATEIGERLMPMAKRLVESFIAATTAAKSMAEGIGTGVIKLVAFAATWIGFTIIATKVIAAISAIVKALRSMALAQAVITAISSPKGIAQLAIGAAAAVAAFIAVDAAFEPIEAAAAKASEISMKAAEGIERIRASLDDAAKPDPLQLKAAADNAKALERQMERIKGRAESLAQSLRTPFEKFIDTIRELKQFQSLDVISGSTFDRALAKAKDDFKNEMKQFDFAKQSISPATGIGAASRFTSEGFSAIQEGNRMLSAMKAAEKIQRDQLEQEKIQNAKLDEIIKNTARAPIELGVADI